MLEKARMKGKKPVNPVNPVAATDQGVMGEGGDEDDGLCCTCGQKVGQHNHVPPPTTTTAGGTKNVGQGPVAGGKTK